MAYEHEELPLFPLDTVLFPHAMLHLHIFEPRYREMVRLCIEEDRPFGIVLIRDDQSVGGSEPYMVGTACRIREVHTYDDGNMDIAVFGERRFRIRALDESRAYLMARVEPVTEHSIAESTEATDLLMRAREEFEALVRHSLERDEVSVHVIFPTDPVILSFTIASWLHIENLQKQRLLEITDTLERIEDLLPLIEDHIFRSGPAYYRISGSDLAEWIRPN